MDQRSVSLNVGSLGFRGKNQGRINENVLSLGLPLPPEKVVLVGLDLDVLIPL